MIDVILTAAMTVVLTAPAVNHPVEYTATNPSGIEIVYSPEQGGWVGRDACPYGCYNEADKPVRLLSGEVDLSTLADWEVTIRLGGVPIVSFWRFFGNVAVYSTP